MPEVRPTADRTPPHPGDSHRRALDLQAQGQWAAAVAAWDEVLSNAPRDAAALANKAAGLRRLGKAADARHCYETAIGIDAGNVSIWFNYGNLLHAERALDAAEQAFRRALDLQPGHVPSLVNLGRLLRDRSRPDEAMAQYQVALQLDPEQAQAHRGLARLLHQQARLVEARPHYEKALQYFPAEASLRSDFGVLLNKLGAHEAAREQWLHCLRIDAHNAVALNNLGALARQLRQPVEALPWLERAHALQPEDPMTVSNLAQVLLDLGQITRGQSLVERVVQRQPEHPDLQLTLGFALVHQGRIDEAIDAFISAADHAPQAGAPLSNALFSSLYRDDRRPEDDTDFHQRIARRLSKPPIAGIAPFPALPPPTALRVGFVSPDFRSHPVACFFAPLLEHFDRQRIETVCYSVTLTEDAVTERIRAATHHWRGCANLPDEVLAAQIRADRCEILVDLAGHTAQNRLTLFRARPAPIQATYMGYPGTTGLPEMDWLIADDTLIPPGQERGCSEQVARLDRPWICYAPLGVTPAVAPAPCVNHGYVTFGSLNNYPKLSEQTVSLWARVLAAVPESRLLLRALALADPVLRAQVPQRFAVHGVDPSRVLALPPVNGQAATLAAYGEIDIALDPLPFNGFTTSCDALWMGVPIITLPGEHYRTRVGQALLQAIGETDCIARDTEDYVAIAQRLAGDREALAVARRQRRARFQSSPLGQSADLAGSMSALFERLRESRITTI